ncbi:MAG: hypothetical protein ACM3SV_10305 [Betaproteobacteria bacterium]
MPSAFKDSIFGEEFTLSNAMGIEVEHDVDPVKVDIEQAAVLFANGQDVPARTVLEAAARMHTGADAERLWRMLLDLLQVLGDRPAFEKLGMEFAQVSEKSPPTWRTEAAPVKAATSLSSVALQGVIAGSDSPGIAKLREAVDKKLPIQVNLGKLVSLDDMAAGVLFDLFRKARKLGLTITLEGAEGLIGRLEGRLQTGQQEYEKGWLLLLELYQLLGSQERFEEKAVDYAVSFEVSPPSWENVKAGTIHAVKETLAPIDENYVISGECKNCRFDDLQPFLELHDHPVIDCSHLKRLDFMSAGMLRNILEPYTKKGKEIVIRHPHHLVAELLTIVGVNTVARIIVTKF